MLDLRKFTRQPELAISTGVAKKSISDLAIFGGTPQFSEGLHVGRPNIGDRERLQARINDILDRRWLTNNGPYVRKFEQRIADFLGVKHCIAMANATIGLEIAIRALGMQGEVIVPSFTFIATAHALQWQEITPVFCDINSTTHTLDPDRVVRHITPKTTGIIGVHTWGQPAEIDCLQRIAKDYHLKLLFDAAHAFSVSHKSQMIGNFGDAEVLSFHATKFLNTFEGGAVVTNNDELATKIRLMKNFGFVGYDQVDYIGTNGKMNEISAAMGLTSLESLDDFVGINYLNYKFYQNELKYIPGIHLLKIDESEKRNYQYIVASISETDFGVNRDQLLAILRAENVLARRYFYPGCHRMQPYVSYFPHAGLLLPVTEQLVKEVLVLPTGEVVRNIDIAQIASILRYVHANARKISKRLSENSDSQI